MFQLLVEPFILPELVAYLDRVNQNEIFKYTVINTVISLFKQTSSSQDDELIDPDIEIFVTSKENAGWANCFCNQVVNIHVVSSEEYVDQDNKQ
jgi:hypothetical protein